MLTILVGRAGSGKTNRILQTMAQRREERKQILLVPEHISHEVELDLCRALGPTASRDAEVLSFQNLASRVLGEAGGAAEFTLDNGGKLLTMRLALQELHSQLKVFGRPSQRAAFLRQLVELADEFYAYEITPDALWQQVADIDDAKGDKLRDIALLYAAYDAKLHSKERDVRSRLQKLRDHVQQSAYLDGKDLYLDGFSFFNRTEESILETALRKANSVTVSLLGDQKNSELFQNALQQRHRLMRLARSCGKSCKIEFISNSGTDELAHLEKTFFDSDEAWEGTVEKISLYEAGTAYTECDWVAAQILQLVRSGKYRFRDIGVSARNMDFYGPILENAFARAAIPAYISRRSDILEKPVINMLLSAVDAVTGDFEYEDMFRYLKTGLAGIEEDDCDLLENYVVRWEIRGSMWLRPTDWVAHPNGYGFSETKTSAAQLARINAVREQVAGPLRQLHEQIKAGNTAKEKAKALYTFAQNSGVPQTLETKVNELLACGNVQLAEETAQLWDILCGVLDQFVEILGECELVGEEFARLLRLVLTQYSVGSIPATLDQVKVSEMTRNDRHHVKCLFLLGANDHLLPSLEGGGGLLDDADRETLLQREIMLSDSTVDVMDQELEFIYAALAQPSEKLWISWATTDLNGAQLRASFVVGRVSKLFPQLSIVREDGSYRFSTESSVLELAGEDPEGQLWQYLASCGRYDELLDAMRKARAVRRGRLSPEAVRTLYGRTIRMSASRMDTIKRCHFGYFMQYGLKAKERRSAGFEAPEIGTFIHYLLENVTRDVMELGGYAAVPKQELQTLVEQYVDRYTGEYISEYSNKSARFRYLFSRLRKAAWAMIENIADELAASDFQPIAFELGFGGDGELPAITIREGETTLSVSGKVDRVDGWIHEDKLYLRVVDYKTGKKSFDLTDLRYGLGIQMLLYLFTLAEKGKDHFEKEVAPAGVLYLPARDVILRTDRNISAEKLRDSMQKELRRSGMVLSDPKVLQAMEHSALDKPCYLPLRISKDGGIGGGVATAAQFGKLGNYVDRLLHQIAQELESGNIDADPCSRGPQDSACTYCEFASACYFEDGCGDDRMRYLKKTDEAEFWTLLDRTEEKEGRHGEA